MRVGLSYLQRLLIVCVSFYMTPAMALPSAFQNHDGILVLSYEPVELPAQETMGLLGGTYAIKAGKYQYLGLGVYGAVSGDRGGFFTGGLDWSLRKSVNDAWKVGGGLFVGGGGGGAAPQGGGLMVRSHLWAGYEMAEDTYVGPALSNVWFPNGRIRSTHWSLALEHRFKVYTSSDPIGVPGLYHLPGLARQERCFYVTMGRYVVPSHMRGRSGRLLATNLDIIGVKLVNSHGHGDFVELETGGAYGGNIDGFAQLFAGYGKSVTISPGFMLGATASMGAAGGGDVPTGGGMMAKAQAWLGADLYSNVTLKTGIGTVRALDDEFRARLYFLDLGYKYHTLIKGSQGSLSTEAMYVNWHPFRMRAGASRYSDVGGGRKNPLVKTEYVDNIVLKIDSYVSRRVYLTGQAHAAIRGGAGGYAVGLVGPGLVLLETRYGSLEAEYPVGAAGGGGLAVGGGFISQPMLNFSIPLSRANSLILGFGYIKAHQGTLDSAVAEISWAGRFGLPRM